MAGAPQAERERIMRLRRQGMSYTKIAQVVGRSRSAVSAIVHRMKHGDRRARGDGDRPPVFHQYRDIKPSKTPFAPDFTCPDFTCPDFAWDDEHCEAVLALRPGGFPVSFKKKKAPCSPPTTPT